MCTTRRVLWLVVLGACANDPVYLPGPTNLEAGLDEATPSARASLTLPVEPETATDAEERAARTAELGVDVPYVKVGDLEVSVEYTIKNLDTMEAGIARVQLNGANEVFAYDPTLVPLLDEDIAAPGLAGDIPITIAPGGIVSGEFREDQLREASVDLDRITRGNTSPFGAPLTVDKNLDMFQPTAPIDPEMPEVPPMPVGPPIPREAFRQIIRVDLVFTPDRHMVLEYTVRVRDIRGIMADDLLATPAGELAAFAPADYAP